MSDETAQRKEHRDQYFESAPSHFQWFQEGNKFLESTVAGNETTPFHSANKTRWNQVETSDFSNSQKMQCVSLLEKF
jgi:hypothetical protein